MSFRPYTAYIVDGCRTAGGRKNSRLSQWQPADLGAEVVNALVARNNLPDNGACIDDVIFGCVSQIGAQAGNLGRNVVLASKLPESVPGTTVDRQCGSSQQAIHFAAQAVMSGTQDVVIAGGVEIMSLIPIGSNIMDVMENRGTPMSENIQERYPDVGMFSQFSGAEMLAKKYNITREEADSFAVSSHARAVAATQGGRFNNEIIEVTGWNKKTDEEVKHNKDEGIRPGTSMESLAKLRPMARGGVLTPGTASQICDGASAVLIVNENGLKKLGLTPMAKIVSMALAGSDPVIMLEGPIPASKKALQQVNMTLDQMDIYEVNEAFASVPLAWARALNGDMKKLNVNGGAMALGHPLGATGTKLMTTLVHEMAKRKSRYGLLAICEGGGTANATIIERVDAAPRARM
jgi:acetyl-CoA acetyltransferase family protein